MGLAELYSANRKKNFGLNAQKHPNSKFSSFSLNLFFSFFKQVQLLFLEVKSCQFSGITVKVVK